MNGLGVNVFETWLAIATRVSNLSQAWPLGPSAVVNPCARGRTHMVRELGCQGTVISGTLPFRWHALGVNFWQCLGRDPKINSEGAGGRRPPTLSELILVNRPKHCRKLTPGAASEMAKYLKSLFPEILVP